MLDYQQVLDLIEAVRTTHGFRKTKPVTDRKVRKALVAELAPRLPETEQRVLGIHPESTGRLYDGDYVSIFAHVVLGARFPVSFAAALESDRVRLVGKSLKRAMPDEFGRRLVVPVIKSWEEAEPGLVYIQGVNVDDPEEADEFEIVTAHGLADELVRASNPGPQQVLALMTLLGFERDVSGKVWTLPQGWAEDVVVKMTTTGLFINGKRLKPWLCLAGQVVGNPVKGELPFKALFWGLQYLLAGSDAAVKGRLRHLTELVVEDSQGPVVKGLAKVKRENTLGFLGVYVGVSGQVNVCNAASIPVDSDVKVDGLVSSIGALDAAGIPWAMQHQGAALYVGPGAQALGMAKRGRKRIYVMAIDRATKTFQRTGSLFVKPSTEARMVELSGFNVFS
jgi:hypothetical protein